MIVSDSGKKEIDGGENPASGDVLEALSGIDGLIALIAKRAASLLVREGGVSDDGLSLGEEILSVEDLAERLALLVPSEVNVDHWERWLSGEAKLDDDRAGRKPARPSTSGRSNLDLALEKGQSMRRCDAEIAALEEKLATARYRRSAFAASEKAWLEIVFLDKVARLLKPMFAMGPAWVLMRAIAFPWPLTADMWRQHGEEVMRDVGQLDTELIERDLIAPPGAPDTGYRPRDVILKTLHGLAGDVQLEGELMVAIYRVCERHQARAAERMRGVPRDYTVPRDGGSDRAERLRTLNESGGRSGK